MEITWYVDNTWFDITYNRDKLSQMGYISSVKLFRPFMGYSLLGVF